MTDTFSDRVDELITEADRRGIDHSDIQLYDPRGAIAAYAELLGIYQPVAFDLSMTLPQIKTASALLK